MPTGQALCISSISPAREPAASHRGIRVCCLPIKGNPGPLPADDTEKVYLMLPIERGKPVLYIVILRNPWCSFYVQIWFYNRFRQGFHLCLLEYAWQVIPGKLSCCQTRTRSIFITLDWRLEI
ncbi:hypothetical protein ACFX2I_008242 [Malus domestica]